MYGKIFSSVFTGSMFGAGADVFAVWSYVIANAQDSVVELNPAMLAATIGTTRKKVSDAIEFLCRPDDLSRNGEEDGRRLVQCGPFQYRVVSHGAYRSIRNEEDRREYNRRKQQEHRARKLTVNDKFDMSLTVNDIVDMSAMSAHTEAETEAEAETKTKATPPKGEPIPDWVPRDSWQNFVAMRKKIRAPLTDKAIGMLIRKLDDLREQGDDPGKVLDKSTERAWRGLFPLEGDRNGKTQRSGAPARVNDAYDALDREAKRKGWSDPEDPFAPDDSPVVAPGPVGVDARDPPRFREAGDEVRTAPGEGRVSGPANSSGPEIFPPTRPSRGGV